MSFKSFNCKYCHSPLSTKQSLSKHQNNRPKRCFILEQKLNTNNIVDATPPVYEPEYTPPTPLTRIQELELELKRLKEPVLTPDQIEILFLKEQLKIAEKKIHLYEPFYNKYKISDTNTLHAFDINNKQIIDEFKNYLENKKVEEALRYGISGLATLCYSFFIPKYYRLINVEYNTIAKYKNNKGDIVIDTDFNKMKEFITPIFVLYGDCIETDIDVLDKLKYDFDLNSLFDKQMVRIFDLEDGKEIRKNTEKMIYALR